MTNLQTTAEPNNKYLNPIANGTSAQVTYRFALTNVITDAYLFSHMAVYNFGGGNSGSGSLWGSKDGSNWEPLADAPTPTGISGGFFYDQNLPPSLLGGSEIWIQARLQTVGWNIMAQFSRTDNGTPRAGLPVQSQSRADSPALGHSCVADGTVLGCRDEFMVPVAVSLHIDHESVDSSQPFLGYGRWNETLHQRHGSRFTAAAFLPSSSHQFYTRMRDMA